MAKKKKPGLFKKIGGAIKQTAQQTAKKAGAGAKKAAQKAGAGAKKALSFAILAPFMPVMVSMLKAKGITPPKDISGTAILFHNHIVRSNIDASMLGDLGKEAAKNPEVITVLIKTIVTFFKNLKSKKDRGEKLTPAEQKALDLADGAIDEAIEAAKDEVGLKIGRGAIDFVQDNWKAIAGVAGGLMLILVIIYMMRGSDKKAAA